MPTITNASDALDLLCAHLQNRFDADFSSEFINGMKVIGEEMEPDPENHDASNEGLPYIALWVDSDDEATADWGQGARRLVVGAKAVATEFNGAIGGAHVASNPVASDVRMSEILYQIMREDYATLRDTGLYATEIRKRRPRRDQDQIVYVKPHDITCVYFPQ